MQITYCLKIKRFALIVFKHKNPNRHPQFQTRKGGEQIVIILNTVKFRQNNKGSKITYRFDLFINLLEIRFTTEKLYKQYDGFKNGDFSHTNFKNNISYSYDRENEKGFLMHWYVYFF